MARRRQQFILLVIVIVSFCSVALWSGIALPMRAGLISRINIWDDTSRATWDEHFSVVQVQSSVDGSFQPAYFGTSNPGDLRPLIVSLHSWSGDYSQTDPLSDMAKQAGWNYVHPNFRGPNWTKDACLSNKALADIDDAIQYAKSRGYVDIDNIFVVGASGGGHAALGAYLRTKHKIKAFLVWVPISDLSAWFYQSGVRGSKYAEDILKCVSDGEHLDQNEVVKRSPMFWDMPPSPSGRLEIYAGINDGYTGSVPISHSILFFNRVATHYGYGDSRVEDMQMVNLLTRTYQAGVAPKKIGDREVIYEKDVGLASLVIFDGSHEMLPEHCFRRMEQIVERGVAQNGDSAAFYSRQ